jgi:hypothetical protein
MAHSCSLVMILTVAPAFLNPCRLVAAAYLSAYHSEQLYPVRHEHQRTGWPLVQCGSTGPPVDGMEEVRFESPEPHLFRRLSDIRPQHPPNINARGCGIGRSPWRGDSHCSIPHLKPDKRLLINSQAVYRPSLVENSRVTISNVEQ